MIENTRAAVRKLKEIADRIRNEFDPEANSTDRYPVEVEVI